VKVRTKSSRFVGKYGRMTGYVWEKCGEFKGKLVNDGFWGYNLEMEWDIMRKHMLGIIGICHQF